MGNPHRHSRISGTPFPTVPENTDVQLRLAEALLADGRLTEARSYLVNLWDRAPGSGEVNLDLAHVSMQTGDMDQSIRYFRGAISGSWEKEPALQRRKVRLELCEFLLAHRQTSDAQAEIAGLAADTPADDGALHEENGRLFLRAGEPGKALAEFEAALHINPRQSQWLADAGQVAFEDGDYLKAETYFSKADRENPSDEIHASLMLVRNVLGNDPFLAGLSDEEQARRSWRDFRAGTRSSPQMHRNSRERFVFGSVTVRFATPDQRGARLAKARESRVSCQESRIAERSHATRFSNRGLNFADLRTGYRLGSGLDPD